MAVTLRKRRTDNEPHIIIQPFRLVRAWLAIALLLSTRLQL